MSRTHDVILYGVTGFTGRQTVEYFRDHAPADLKWAIAARNEEKLNRRADELNLPPGIPRLVADARDAAAVGNLVANTRVILSTAGPYALYGEAIVAAAAREGTHYVDITGEAAWVRDMIDKYDSAARTSGAKIIPFCGFDSIPADISVYLAREFFRDRGAGLAEARGYYSVSGGLNGGTLYSGINMYETGAYIRMADPSLLVPEGPVGFVPLEDPLFAHYASSIGHWVAPFIMAQINTRVVNRSAALAHLDNEPYGDSFSYQEYHKLGGPLNPFTAAAAAATMGAMRTFGPFGAARALMKSLGPAPGEGPSEKTMRDGKTEYELVARGENGAEARVTLSVDGDPGNRATVLFVCESALALAVNESDLPGGKGRAGLLTPAYGMGGVLVKRLRGAGARLEVSG